MQVSHEDMRHQLKIICRDLMLSLEPKNFQVDFFVAAASGINGFLRVMNLILAKTFNNSFKKNVSPTGLD